MFAMDEIRLVKCAEDLLRFLSDVTVWLSAQIGDCHSECLS